MIAFSLLSGCFLPDRFDAQLVINNMGIADFRFEGDLVYIPGWVEISADRLSVDDAAFHAILAAIREDPAVTRARYLGDARFRLDYQRTAAISAGEHIMFPPIGLPLLTVARGAEGAEDIIELRGTSLAAADLRTLERMGLRLRGEIEVQIDGVVEAHNAQTLDEDGVFSTIYRWLFDDLLARPPYLRMRQNGNTTQ